MSAATIARKPLTYIAGGVAVLALVFVLISATSSPAGATVSGTYDLDAGYATAGNCVGAGEYPDIYEGAPVWVFDEPGHPLASSTLVLAGQDKAACHFTFAVSSAAAPVWVQVGDQAKVRVSDGLALRSGAPRQP